MAANDMSELGILIFRKLADAAEFRSSARDVDVLAARLKGHQRSSAASEGSDLRPRYAHCLSRVTHTAG